MGGLASGLFGNNSVNTAGAPEAYGNATNAQNATIAGEQGLQNQAQQIATNGSGLAAAQLQAGTNQNIQNAAGVVASQKGVNPALAARMAGQQAAQAGQTSANQAATLQGQTQLAGLQQAAGIAGQIGNQQGQQISTAGSIIGSTASGNEQTQSGVAGGLLSGAGGALGLAKGGIVQRFADGGSPLPQDGQISSAAGAPSSPIPSAGPKSKVGQALSGIGGGSPQLTGAQQGGQALGKAFGTGLKSLFGSASPDAGEVTGGVGQAGNELSSGVAMGNATEQLDPYTQHMVQQQYDDGVGAEKDAQGGMTGQGGIGTLAKLAPLMLKSGGKVPALLSPGERYLAPDKVAKVAQGKADPIKDGKKVPGKPKVKGAKNSYANDTIPATLEEGGIVIPRSITEGKHPHREAYKFVNAVLAKNKMKK